MYAPDFPEIASAKIPLSRMISPSLYWIMSGDDFTLDINNPDEPKVLCVGNNPDRQNIYSAALVPTDFSVKPATVFIERQPYNDRFAHSVVFGYKAPITGVGRIMAVVTHHPVVIHFEGIFIGFFTVDIDTVRLHFQLVAFVCHDTTFVDRQVVRSQRNSFNLIDELTVCENVELPLIYIGVKANEATVCDTCYLFFHEAFESNLPH